MLVANSYLQFKVGVDTSPPFLLPYTDINKHQGYNMSR